MDTPTVASPIVPSALDLAVAQDAAALSTAPSELQLLIGALENISAGVLPSAVAAGMALTGPTGVALTPEALAAAALLAAELKALPAAQAAASDATASAATAIGIQAVGPAIAKIAPILALCLLGGLGWAADPDLFTSQLVVVPREAASLSWLAHLQAIVANALPWIITILGALLALGKVVQPELAKKSPAIGNAIALFDHVVDFIYETLTSRAGLAEDAQAEAHTKALTGLLTHLQSVAADPVAQAAIAVAISKLPAASQDAVKELQADLPVALRAYAGQTAPVSVLDTTPKATT